MKRNLLSGAKALAGLGYDEKLVTRSPHFNHD